MRIPKKTELMIISIVLINLLIISIITYTLLSPKAKSTSIKPEDYDKALKYSIIFYDANKCGKEVSFDNAFDWRGPCHIDDGTPINVDLSGGFHDGWGHVKYGITQGYTASMLGWSLIEYQNVLERTGNKNKLLSTLKYFTDYFLKCHVNESTFYYQIGDDLEDNIYLGPPERQTEKRPVICVADITHPAADVCGETSAALSLMFLNYKDKDLDYANKCLLAAKELYIIGKNNPGFSERQSSYISGSFYDDLAWAALWLYQIEKEKQYLDDAEEFVLKSDRYDNDPLRNEWTLCWDDVSLACFLELYDITKKQIYSDALNYNLDYWKNKLKTTRGGLKYLTDDGVLRYAAAESMIAMHWYKVTGDDSLKTFAKSQIDYILGANPTKTSYIIGIGKNPKNILHRAANGMTESGKPEHVLYGALLGGPTDEDKFIDERESYKNTGVTLDYNAVIVGSIASILDQLK